LDDQDRFILAKRSDRLSLLTIDNKLKRLPWEAFFDLYNLGIVLYQATLLVLIAG
jgi:hypothetical protein